jgi:hypothetical protein
MSRRLLRGLCGLVVLLCVACVSVSDTATGPTPASLTGSTRGTASGATPTTQAKLIWVESREWLVGDSGVVGTERVVNPSQDAVDVEVLPGPDWALVGGRTVNITIEQSVNNGPWQHWVGSGDMATGRLPRSGRLIFGITSSPIATRKIRIGSVVVTGAPVVFALEFEVSRRGNQ